MSKLLHRSIPPCASKMITKYIWIRAPDCLPTVFLTRKFGRPVDLLVRVPASTLSNKSNNLKLKNSSSKPTDHHRLNFKQLSNVKYCFVPKRNFGLSRKNPPFGHQRIKGNLLWMEPFVMLVGFTLMFIPFLDWRRIKEEYGIDILPKFMYDAYTQTGVDGDGRVNI